MVKKKRKERSKYTFKRVKAAITKASKYRSIKNGNWPNSFGYRFTYRHETAEILGCAYKHVDKLVRRLGLRYWVDEMNKRERAKHIKKVNDQSPKLCTLCRVKKPYYEFGKFGKLFAGKRKMCKACLKARDEHLTHKQTFKFRKPESFVEEKMRALDLHREIKAIRKKKQKQEPDRECSFCGEVKPRTDFRSDYDRLPDRFSPNTRVARSFKCSACRKQWYKDYEDVLIGITTTSLYGVHSQYNAIPHWKTLGESAGKIAIKPDDDAYFVWANWLKENHREEFDKAQNQTGPKQNTIARIFKHLGIKGKDYEHGFHRGVFFANMYENGSEYLRKEIKEKELVMKPKYIDDSAYIMKWWKPKAIRRYTKLFDEGRLKPEKLFYGDIVGKTWEETKKMYLSEVGR